VATIDTVKTISGKNRYRVRWRDPDHRQRAQSFTRLDDARTFKTSTENALQRNTYVDRAVGKVTIAELFATFIESQPLEPATRALYRMLGRRYLGTEGPQGLMEGLPNLGAVAVNRIKRTDVKVFIAKASALGVGAPTVRSAYRLLHRLLEEAVEDSRIGSNPATGIRLPRVEPRRQRVLTPQEVDTLASEVPGRDRALILFLSYCGPRIGEAAGLRVKDVDTLRGRVTISGALKEVGGRIEEGQTKTKKKRAIMLPAFLRDELTQHLARFSNPRDPEGFVFSGPDGGPLRANNWRKRVLYPACERAGITPTPHTHDLRHTAASLGIRVGMHPKELAEMLGHSSIRMTMDTYGHLFPSLHDERADKLDALYRQPDSKAAGTAAVVTIK
jgi:integrase